MTRCVGQSLPIMTAARSGSGIQPAVRERGVALVVALVFLLMLTILGVTVMQTASLEGRMAGNTQETNRAFQAAESAIEHVFTDGAIFNNLIYPGSVETTTLQYPTTNPNTTVTVTATYAAKRNTMPRARDRSNINSATGYGAAVFDLNSAATTSSQANTRLMQGVAQATPKNE
jgi:Tfp pilus assembly protein PilX